MNGSPRRDVLLVVKANLFNLRSLLTNILSSPTTNSVNTKHYPPCYQYEGFPRFLELPPELRNNIYRFGVADLPSRVVISKRTRISKLVFLPEALPNICFTSKSLHREAVLVFLQRTRLVFSDKYPRSITAAVESLHAFLAQFNRSYESIRILTFHEVEYFGEALLPYLRDLNLGSADFLSRCPELQHLVVEFPLVYLAPFVDIAQDGIPDEDWEDWEPRVRLLTRAEIRERWDLGALFAMTRLRSVKMRCWEERWDMWREELGSLDQICHNLREVLREGLARRDSGREVTWSVEAVLPS